MTQKEIIDYLQVHKEAFAKKYGISRMALFGSYARGEERPESDIDIAIETKLSDYFLLYDFKEELEKVHIDEELERYIIQLIAATRDPGKFGITSIEESLMFGASPRASIDLYKASKAKAFLRGNDHVTPADIGFVVHDVLRHRIVLSYEARAKGISTDEIISVIVKTLPIP
jgi:predicted nucleotidyltransferase